MNFGDRLGSERLRSRAMERGCGIVSVEGFEKCPAAWKNLWFTVEGQTRYRSLRLMVGLEAPAQKKSPVIFTCGVSVLQDLLRTKAVLGGL